ncbi:MAG: type III-B CRISPR module RAMP protein Cmr4 [Ardenticatenia bacterium]|nr:MAG: type III-B CRISPR module RAMP protein Cmr4 [Ardenticatenia bacterium]
MGTHNPQTSRFFLMTIDPVHIGTGGTRLGRVDLSIVREPGTNLPKIPGTSFSGAIRSYAAYRYGKRRCAGQGQPGSEKASHCGRPTCPICYTFGAITGERSYSGVVSIGDARILLFPVYSMAGPVWVTSPMALFDAGFGEKKEDNKIVPFNIQDGMAKWLNSLTNTKQAKQDQAESSKNNNHGRFLNLGWLMVEKEDDLSLQDLPDLIPTHIRERVVLVSNKLFSQIVNSNLEVRTSVSINPETGAAEDKALFTYEAIPRATVLWMDVVVDDYRDKEPWKNSGVVWKAYREERTNAQGKQEVVWHDNDQRGGPLYPDPQNPQQPEQVDGQPKAWKSARDVVTAGLEWCEHLGIGGMGTRGFGRVCMVDHQEVPYDKTHA